MIIDTENKTVTFKSGANLKEAMKEVYDKLTNSEIEEYTILNEVEHNCCPYYHIEPFRPLCPPIPSTPFNPYAPSYTHKVDLSLDI